MASTSGFLVANFNPELCIVDEAAVARHYEVLMPIIFFVNSVRRLLLVGDHCQIGPYFSTIQGNKAWKVTIFGNMMQNGWPATLLESNYRTRSALVLPNSQLFYDARVVAVRETTGPWVKKFLDALTAGRPCDLYDHTNQSTTITGYTHFLNVANSKEMFENDTPMASTQNEPEADAITALVALILWTDVCDASQLMIIVGYRAQQLLLKKRPLQGVGTTPTLFVVWISLPFTLPKGARDAL